jgi:hypothetical protein
MGQTTLNQKRPVRQAASVGKSLAHLPAPELSISAAVVTQPSCQQATQKFHPPKLAGRRRTSAAHKVNTSRR